MKIDLRGLPKSEQEKWLKTWNDGSMFPIKTSKEVMKRHGDVNLKDKIISFCDEAIHDLEEMRGKGVLVDDEIDKLIAMYEREKQNILGD